MSVSRRRAFVGIEKAAMAMVLLALFWVPLPVASDRDWALGILLILLSVAGVLWALMELLPTSSRYPELEQEWFKLGYIGLAMLLLLLLVQLWVGAQWLFGVTERPSMTAQYLMLGLGLSLLFFLLLQLFFTRKRLNILLATLVFSGVFQAFYGTAMMMSGIEYLLGVAKTESHGSATGTFENRNHLAGYLEMTIALAIGWLLALRSGERFDMRALLDYLSGPKMRIRLGLVVMVVALVTTHSRMGNIAFFASLMVVGLIFILLQKENRLRNSLLLVSFVVIDIVIISQFFGLERLQERLLAMPIAMEQGALLIDATDLRSLAVEQMLPMIADNPFLGVGAGAFEYGFVRYAGEGFWSYFYHAHNDVLQFIAELGWLAFLFLVGFVGLALWQALRALANTQSRYRSGIGFGAAMAIIALMLHSLVDFNLQMPANAMTFVTVCAIAVLANRHYRHE